MTAALYREILWKKKSSNVKKKKATQQSQAGDDDVSSQNWSSSSQSLFSFSHKRRVIKMTQKDKKDQKKREKKGTKIKHLSKRDIFSVSLYSSVVVFPITTLIYN